MRFAVKLAEQLEQTSALKAASPSTEGCYTCLAVLREMMPLLGPLAPVLRNVYDALMLCLLSQNYYTDGTFMDDPSSPARWGPAADEQRAFENVAAAAGRVPFFVLVRKLEEATAALRLERDTALEQVARHQIDLRQLDDQLATAKAQLQGKTATIDKLVREHAQLETDLAKAREAPSEAKYEALQQEAAMMTRDFLTRTQELEAELEVMKSRVKLAEAEHGL